MGTALGGCVQEVATDVPSTINLDEGALAGGFFDAPVPISLDPLLSDDVLFLLSFAFPKEE